MKIERKTARALVLIAAVVASVALSACNTVRGVAKDVTKAADTLDPDKN